jgi:hypothetical protein
MPKRAPRLISSPKSDSLSVEATGTTTPIGSRFFTGMPCAWCRDPLTHLRATRTEREDERDRAGERLYWLAAPLDARGGPAGSAADLAEFGMFCRDEFWDGASGVSRAFPVSALALTACGPWPRGATMTKE